MPANNGGLKGWLSTLKNPAWLCFVWFGMTAGISILETPVRFMAPLLNRAEALDVGRVAFAALNKAELVALVLLLILVRVSGLASRYWAVTALLAMIVIVQSAWLLPELSARAMQIAAGTEPPPSPVHALYSTLELLKLGTLFGLGVSFLRQSREPLP